MDLNLKHNASSAKPAFHETDKFVYGVEANERIKSIV